MAENGNAYPVVAIGVKTKIQSTTTPIGLRPVSWKGTPAAFGQAQTIAGKTTVTVIERPTGVTTQAFAEGQTLRELPRDKKGLDERMTPDQLLIAARVVELRPEFSNLTVIPIKPQGDPTMVPG